MTELRIVNAEALVVGPDDVLLLKIRGDVSPDLLDAIYQVLVGVGLRDRSIVVSGDIEIGKVNR